MLTHLDLFSGIGGFSIAAEATGFTTVAFAETDPDASAILNYWWPEVPNLGDVERVSIYDKQAIRCCASGIDLVTGGVPCQPTSHVGLMRGTSDPRWMWPAAIRAMRLLQPRVAVYENPPALLILEGGRAFNGIVSEMVALGYDLWWDIFPAAAFGAGHLRERLIIVATNTHSERGQQESRGSPSERAHGLRTQDDHELARLEQVTANAHGGRDWQQPDATGANGPAPEGEQARPGGRENAPNADSQRWAQAREQCLLEGSAVTDDLRRQSTSSNFREATPDACHDAPEQPGREFQHPDDAQHRGPCADDSGTGGSAQVTPDAQRPRLQGHGRISSQQPGARRPAPPSDLRGRVSRTGPNGEDWWSEVVTGVPVLAHGLPNKLVEAISRCTGNAVVPQTLVPLLTAIRDMIL